MKLATRKGIAKKFAIKCYDKQHDNTGGIEAIIDEFTTMEELEHKNVWAPQACTDTSTNS